MIVFLCVVLGCFICVWWYLQDKRRCLKFPPGPPRVPVLGCLPFLPWATTPSTMFAKLIAKYGDVLHLKLGMLDAVVFNSHESVSALLKHDKANAVNLKMSLPVYERNHRRNIGLVFSSGSPHDAMRHFTERTLRDYGFGKTASMDFVVNQEFQKFMADLKSRISQLPDGVLPNREMFFPSTMSVIWRFLTAVDYDLGSEKLQQFIRLADKTRKSGNLGLNACIAFPILWDMFPRWSGKNLQAELNEEYQSFISEIIREHRKTKAYDEESRCYVDAFLEKIEETVQDANSEFNDEQIYLCLEDALLAGAETNSTTMEWFLLYMILHPNIQKKVQHEIDSEVGEKEDIVISMRNRLPYTYATLLEMQRMASIVPFTPPRVATEDFYFNGYLIKQGMTLLVNLEAANMDNSVWIDPQNLRPDRYLTTDGAIDMEVTSNLLVFGTGKRACLGKSLAETFLFVYFTSLLRSFELRKVPGDTLSATPKLGMTYTPQPFRIQFVPRRKKQLIVG